MTNSRTDINYTSSSLPSENDPATLPPQIRVCHNTACKQAGSAQIFQKLQALNLPNIEVLSVGCFGECGKGPTILVLPEQAWYHYVQPGDVEAIATQHFAPKSPHTIQENTPKDAVDAHDHAQLWAYGFLGLALLLALGSCCWTIYAAS